MGGGGCRGDPSPPAVASARSGGVALSCPVGSVAAPPALPGCLPAVWLWQSGDDVPQWGRQLIEWQIRGGFASCITTLEPCL